MINRSINHDHCLRLHPRPRPILVRLIYFPRPWSGIRQELPFVSNAWTLIIHRLVLQRDTLMLSFSRREAVPLGGRGGGAVYARVSGPADAHAWFARIPSAGASERVSFLYYLRWSWSWSGSWSGRASRSG